MSTDKHIYNDFYCKTCYYNIAHQENHVCPECGRPFDPNDKTTYFRRLPEKLNYTGISITICCFTFVAMLFGPAACFFYLFLFILSIMVAQHSMKDQNIYTTVITFSTVIWVAISFGISFLLQFR